jgi:hypothetical protein
MMKTLCFVFIILLLPLTLLFSQETDYQRNDLVLEESELTVESGVRMGLENINTDTFYNFSVNGSIEYAFLSHSVKASLPYTLMFYDNQDALNRFFYYLGDISLSYEYLKQLSHLNLFLGSFFNIPISVSNEYAAREGVYASSEGRYEAGFSFSVTGIRDPVVWSAGLRYTFGLPMEERYYTTWRPGTIQASLGLSDLLNDRFGYSIGILEMIILPRMIDMSMEPVSLTMRTGFKLEVIILFERNYVQLSAESYLFPLYQPVTIGITYGHNFNLVSK